MDVNEFERVVSFSLDELKKKKYETIIYDRHINGVVAYHLGKNYISFNTADFNKIIEKIKENISTDTIPPPALTNATSVDPSTVLKIK